MTVESLETTGATRIVLVKRLCQGVCKQEWLAVRERGGREGGRSEGGSKSEREGGRGGSQILLKEYKSNWNEQGESWVQYQEACRRMIWRNMSFRLSCQRKGRKWKMAAERVVVLEQLPDRGYKHSATAACTVKNREKCCGFCLTAFWDSGLWRQYLLMYLVTIFLHLDNPPGWSPLVTRSPEASSDSLVKTELFLVL